MHELLAIKTSLESTRNFLHKCKIILKKNKMPPYNMNLACRDLVRTCSRDKITT